MEKFRVLLVILVITVFAFRLWQTTGCKKFTDFHFQPISVKADVESAINVDSGGKIVPRFFHNKITYGLFDFSKTYFLTLQPSYLLELLGPVGLVLSVLAVPKAVYFKSKILLFNLFMILLFSLFLISSFNPKIAFYLLALSWYAFSINSLEKVTKKNLLIFILILIPVTFLYYLYTWRMHLICNEILFN